MRSKVIKFITSDILKLMSFSAKKRHGKSHTGHTSVYGRGGGVSRQYILIDFYRRLNDSGLVCHIDYDANRTALIGLTLYKNGLFHYIILSDGVFVGNYVYSGIAPLEKTSFSVGSCIELFSMPLFSIINNIETRPYYGASLTRSAGTGAVLVSSDYIKNQGTIKLSSGWYLTLLLNCIATFGYVSNLKHHSLNLGKAGVNRRKGFRPGVRGVAMNPCDHPHGGGNGKTSPPSSPVTPWGHFTKGTPTKKKKIDKLRRRFFKKLR